MKSMVRWMALAVVALVSNSAWAAWDPDADANLIFWLNFETGYYNNAAHTATDAKAGLVGTLQDYNTTYPNVFGEASKTGLGKDANFALIHDHYNNIPGAGIENGGTPTPNDCRLRISNDGTFDLGTPANKHTWTFWFNVPDISKGTIIRHANISSDPCDPYYADYKNFVWEIRILGGSMQFYHKNNCLYMVTDSTLSDMGIDVNTWHSAAIVIDRTNVSESSAPTTNASSKIYIDGLEVPVVITNFNTNSMNVDPFGDSPIWFGAGDKEFDGLLDDIRLYSRSLTPVEVSVLNQPDHNLPVALLPIPRSSEVIIATDLNWVPSTLAVTAQKIYFGTDSNNLALKKTYNDGTSHIVSNADIGGPLKLNTQYYWLIKSTIGSDVNGPLWSFTTETGKAIDPNPPDGAEDINNSDVNLSWNTPSAATYTVYASTSKSLVDNNDVSVQIASGLSQPNFIGFDPCNIGGRGQVYYWRVNSTYGPNTVAGYTWSFRTKPYELVFNTSDANTTYANHVLLPYACDLHGDGWTNVTTGSLETDGVAVFDFPCPNGFNYDRRYDIIVQPDYRGQDVNDDINLPRPLAIHSDCDFYFDGRVQIAGDDILTTSQDYTFARSGGYPGPKHNQDTGNAGVFGDSNHSGVLTATYWNSPSMPAQNHGRFGIMTSAKPIFIPTDMCKRVFGPGQPVNPPYKGGGGGGAGGVGGDSGRGFFFGIFSGGPSYGDKEVPVPFGGSSGGWGGDSSPGGAAGGGGIEIVAAGNVTLDSNSQIRAWGGGQLISGTTYPAGGGGGGSVRIIAGGSVTNKGIINVNGGEGGDGGDATKGNNTGGGGGGGRVAIFYGTTCSAGTITANGGARGTIVDPNYHFPVGLAQNGQPGTIFTTSGSPAKASCPTPKNGDTMVYCNPDPCTIQLQWYSGYGGTTDRIYCDNNTNPTTQIGSDVAATRGQHSVTMSGVNAGKTYFMKVVTDGTVNSDIWSFKTTSWQCPFVIDGNAPHVGGQEWDFNHDCVIDMQDLDYISNYWLNTTLGSNYLVQFTFFRWFANEWLTCDNRTNGGCAGWYTPSGW